MPILSRSSPLKCDQSGPAFTDPAFTCPPGYKEVQRPQPPPDTIYIRKPPTGSLSIHYYWKPVLSLPTSCGNVSKFSAETQVEQSAGITAELQAKIGSVNLSYEIKTTDTLGFEIPFGEADYIYQVTLYQLHSYIHYFEHVSTSWPGTKIRFLLAVLSYELGFSYDPSFCEEQDIPLKHFELHACRKPCR